MVEPKKLRLVGMVSAQATEKPMSNVIVTALAKDIPGQIELGRAITDKSGRFEVVIDQEILRRNGLKPDIAPRIALNLIDSKGRTILTTQQAFSVQRGANMHVDLAVPGVEHGPNWPEMAYIAGQPVNLTAAAKLTASDLMQMYRYLRNRGEKPQKYETARLAFPGLFALRDPMDDCAEGRFDVFRILLMERGIADALRETDADDLPTGATAHWFYTDRIAVKYTTDTAFPNDRVDPTTPAADDPVPLSDGTIIGWVRKNLADLHPDNTEVAPTYVQQVGVIAEYALGRYLSSDFNVRDPRAGAARMEYRIIHQGSGIAGGTSGSWSHIEVAPNNGFLQNLHTVPHEMFHQVQYRYNNTTTRSGIYGMLREGGARFIEDCIDDQPNRYVVDASMIFSDPSYSLADSPSVGTAVTNSTPIRYAAGIFWKYMAERHSTQITEPSVGVDAYRKALEATATVQPGDPGIGYDPSTLRAARRDMPWYGSFDEFFYYDAAQTELSSHETTWGNYLIANYLHGICTPGIPCFDYLEDDQPVSWPGATVASLSGLQATVKPGDSIALAQGSSITRSVVGHKAWAARYYRIAPNGTPGPRLLRVSFTAAAGMTDPLVQILRVGPDNSLVDIHRSDKASYTKTINLSGLGSVVVIVGSRSTAGDFTVQFDEVASSADTMITRWNSAVGTEYEIDPHGWAWAWISPDIMVDNNNDNLADTEVYFGTNNKLKVRLRNRGNQTANNISIDFWYQKATPHLSAANWIPVTNATGDIQQITGATLAPQGSPGSESWFVVDWAPEDDGTHDKHWCVKVRVTAPGEPNTDNKMVLSNFANVIPSGEGDELPLLVRLPDRLKRAELIVVPRGPQWALKTQALPKQIFQARGLKNEPQSLSSVSMPVRSVMSNVQPVRRRLTPWDGRICTAKPGNKHYYSVNPKTLPPGVNPQQLVTVVQSVDGRITGGITYQIASEGR